MLETLNFNNSECTNRGEIWALHTSSLHSNQMKMESPRPDLRPLKYNLYENVDDLKLILN